MSTPHATVAEEEYLQTLFWLHEVGLPMTGANVARAMQLSAPTVHEMIGRLERDGYIERAADKVISFTPTGQEHAEGIVSRHRLIERYLTDVVGVPWDDVHEEAERLEHAMSPRFEAYMRRAIGGAKTCPHGHPIEVGDRGEAVPLADVEVGAKVRWCGSRTRPRTCCTTSRTPVWSPGLEGVLEEKDDRGGRRAVDGRRALRRDPVGRRDDQRDRRPQPAVTDGVARPAGAGQGPLGDVAGRTLGRLDPASGLLDDAGLQLHRAEAVDLAVDVVVADAVDQADVADLGADLDRLSSCP